MKKFFIIALIALVAMTSAFAKSDIGIGVGVSGGYSQFVNTEHSDLSVNIIPLAVDTMIYIGDSIAVNPTVGMDLYTDNSDNLDTGLSLGANVYYNMEMSKTMNLLLGGGLRYNFLGYSVTTLGTTTKYSRHRLSILASVRFEFEATDSLTTFAALNAGATVMNNTNTSVSNSLVSGGQSRSSDTTLIPWGISAGLSYKF